MNIELLTPIPAPLPLAELLARFGEWDCIVEHHIFEAQSLVGMKSHYQVALSALEAQRERSRLARPWLKNHWWEVRQDKISPALGQLWTLQQFFGPAFNVETKTLCLWGTYPAKMLAIDFQGEVTPAANQEIEWAEWAEEFDGYSNFSAKGYIAAVCNPPYGLQVKTEVFGPPLVALIRELFDELDTLSIVSWPVECCNYFDPGLYWWGSYFWTVHVPKKGWVVAILVSGTD